MTDRHFNKTLNGLSAKLCEIATNTNNFDLTSIENLLGQIVEVLSEDEFIIKSLPPIKYCCPNGDEYYLVICLKYTDDGVFVESEEIWIDSAGIIPAKPACAVPCVDEDICNPWIGSGYGDALPTEEITDLTLILPSCNCEVILETSIGTIHVKNKKEICVPSVECPYTITGITIDPSSTCTLEDIEWYASRKK